MCNSTVSFLNISSLLSWQITWNYRMVLMEMKLPLVDLMFYFDCISISYFIVHIKCSETSKSGNRASCK